MRLVWGFCSGGRIPKGSLTADAGLVPCGALHFTQSPHPAKITKNPAVGTSWVPERRPGKTRPGKLEPPEMGLWR